MSDQPTAGDRLDAKLEAVRQTVGELRADVEQAGDALQQRTIDAVNALSAEVDELQADWANRTATDVDPPTDPPPPANA